VADVRIDLGQGASLGPYRIVALLGSGGMGEVYLAHDTRLDREVAVKILPRSFAGDAGHASRFEREAKTLASLNHPNILAVHDYGQHEDFSYLVTERLEGMTLQEHLASGPLSPRAAVRIGVQVAQGLAAAHEKGIVHRDLKPSNVFITRDGRTKILDFGLARFSEREEIPREDQSEVVTAECVTTPGTIIGTVGYMAPEQVRGKKTDPRSDVFSFGVILYEMLAGRRPFQGRSEADVLASILKEDPPSINQADAYVPPVLEALVRRCLNKDPARRYASGREVWRALDAATGDVSKDPTPAPRPARRNLLAPAAGGLFAVMAVVGVLLVFWLRAKPAEKGLPQFQPHQVTSLAGWSSQPAVSPDGMAVAFTVENEKGSDILIQDIRGGTPLKLTSNGGSNRDPTWFPDGSAIAFTAEQGSRESIWKVPRFGGTPVLLIPNAREPAVSLDGRRIAFARVSPGQFRHIAVADLAALQDVRVLTGNRDGMWDLGHPAWSPDGKTLCYQDHNDLWLVPTGGGRARKLTDDDPNDTCPVWSPDGRHVYFSSFREGTTAIWRIDVGSRKLDRVTTGSSSEQSPSLSRNGRCLVYDTQTNKMSGFVVDRRTGRRWPLPRSQYLGEPSVSPAGRDVVFCSNLEGRINLWRMSLKNGEPSGWPQRLLETEGTCSHAAYSPDGRWIAYQVMRGGLRDVWVMPAGGGVPVKFTTVGGMNAQPEWSPDGGRISFISDRSGTYQVWAAPFKDGTRAGNAVQITRGWKVQGSQTWSPRGDRIAYITEDAAGCDLWVAPVSGKSPVVRLTHRVGANFAYWDRMTGTILLSALWSGHHYTLKAVPPDGGTPRPVTNTASSDPRADVLEIDASLDGRLFAVVERESEGEVWALQVDEGSF